MLRPMIHAAVSLVLAGMVAATATAAGQVDMNFIEPARFNDAGFSEVEAGRTVDALTRHLQGFASRMPEGQSLRVEVLDVDPAGWVLPGSRHDARDMRVLRGRADAPSIRLPYALTAEGRTLLAVEDRLTDLDDLSSSVIKQASGDYGHELCLLDESFKERIAAR